ncbi:hypothetical protein C464_03105 [Halorubrum coriense DSM 10284]|uniref:Uncharacterized protein n=1 Tax=Halorubrum coriense DSM 10284 TaxID=1227466 RepID=M0EQY0_9EURY|nr:hypothetical protein C464_03105 [Halorubrum coriense DSM 10284]
MTPWTARCERCPAGERFLAERPARRWAETHARHARHAVSLEAPSGDSAVVSPGDEADRS